jgi:hypothetical protein
MKREDVETEEDEYELEKVKIWSETEKYRTEKIVGVINNVVSSIKEYYATAHKHIIIATFILIGVIFSTVAMLTFFGIVKGETFAFLAGTIIGYIISLVAGKR